MLLVPALTASVLGDAATAPAVDSGSTQSPATGREAAQTKDGPTGAKEPGTAAAATKGMEEAVAAQPSPGAWATASTSETKTQESQKPEEGTVKATQAKGPS